jgi:hypothetical protein
MVSILNYLRAMNANLSDDIQSFLDLQTTKEFLAVADKFIQLLETKEIVIEDFVKHAHEILASLYCAGFNLQTIDLKYSDDKSDFDRDSLFENKNVNLIAELGDEGFYWEIFDPCFKQDNDKVLGYLVDDFGDIYRDLKIELEKIKINSDEAVEDALWQLKFNFHHHWGNHCIDALRYFHWYWYNNKL